jgi:hypothetical protein
MVLIATFADDAADKARHEAEERRVGDTGRLAEGDPPAFTTNASGRPPRPDPADGAHLAPEPSIDPLLDSFGPRRSRFGQRADSPETRAVPAVGRGASLHDASVASSLEPGAAALVLDVLVERSAARSERALHVAEPETPYFPDDLADPPMLKGPGRPSFEIEGSGSIKTELKTRLREAEGGAAEGGEGEDGEGRPPRRRGPSSLKGVATVSKAAPQNTLAQAYLLAALAARLASEEASLQQRLPAPLSRPQERDVSAPDQEPWP